MKQLFLLVLIIFSTQIFSQKKTESTKKHRKVKHVEYPRLKGSTESLKAQHARAEKEDLSYIENERQLANMKKIGKLIPITSKVQIDLDEVKERFRCVRPRVNNYLVFVEDSFDAKFGKGDYIWLTSATRTEQYQRDSLCSGKNKNANASKNSSHPTGATIDFRKRSFEGVKLTAIRNMLSSLEAAGYIEATEEHHKKHSCFHVMVYNSFTKYFARYTKEKNARGKSKLQAEKD